MPAAIPPKVREVLALEDEMKRLRMRIGAAYPLEAQEIWDRACLFHERTELTLEQAVEEAEWEMLLPDSGWPLR